MAASLNHTLFDPSISLAWKWRWEDRLLYGKHMLTDVRLNWKVKPVALYLDAMNLFNQSYQDYFHIPLPGRWVKLGVQFELK